MENENYNSLPRVLIVGGFQRQWDLIGRLCQHYGTTYFQEYDGGKVSRLDADERKANRLYFIDGYHMNCCQDDEWELILVMPDYDDYTQRLLDGKPNAKCISFLNENVSDEQLFAQAVNTIFQILRIE